MTKLVPIEGKPGMFTYAGERVEVELPLPLGWRCPVCKRGLAPHVSECSCTEVLRLDQVGVGDEFIEFLKDTPPEA